MRIVLSLLVYGFAIGICLADTVAERAAYKRVMCPEKWTSIVCQRYDDRNRRGIITKSTWVCKCQ